MDKDVVEVVRCGDCRFNFGYLHNRKYDANNILCTYWEIEDLCESDYCSRGEKQWQVTSKLEKH